MIKTNTLTLAGNILYSIERRITFLAIRLSVALGLSVAYVTTDGDDATGNVGRKARPFGTINGAIQALEKETFRVLFPVVFVGSGVFCSDKIKIAKTVVITCASRDDTRIVISLGHDSRVFEISKKETAHLIGLNVEVRAGANYAKCTRS